MFDPADLDELVEILKIAGVKSAGVVMADITPPGVLVQLTSFSDDLLSGDTTYRIDLVLVAPDIDPRRAMGHLATLYGPVRAAVAELGGPAGDVRAATATPPEGGPLAALVVPITMTGETATPPDPDPTP